jgi:ATP-binding cassette subfamily C (CFTR/MRP) protein 1
MKFIIWSDWHLGTGAGKSSLAQTLFRLVELAGGDIEIDGYNLQNIGLDTLRSQLSALPQDTLLFSGTMRDNLDPTGIKTDYELNEILQRCGLEATGKDFERLRKFRLDSKVSDDGDNFSWVVQVNIPAQSADIVEVCMYRGGERQLGEPTKFLAVKATVFAESLRHNWTVALCRALVKNSKVLLLDEATSSVDPETDTMIQDCIRKSFSDVTLLCIAHRLATIVCGSSAVII